MMTDLSREQMEALYNVFQKAALNDQRSYYRSAVARARTAAGQVNRWRASFALLAGLASAGAGLIVSSNTDLYERCNLARLDALQATLFSDAQTTLTQGGMRLVQDGVVPAAPVDCGLLDWVVPLLLVVAVVAPAVGAAFTTLADLFQWDRIVTIYDAALENLEVADAQSPLPAMDDMVYRASLNAYAEGTLQVMRDETAQWGQLIKTPAALEKYIESARRRSEAFGGVAPASQSVPPGGFISPENNATIVPPASPPSAPPVVPPPTNPLPPDDSVPG